jgi:hypothetical protein
VHLGGAERLDGDAVRGGDQADRLGVHRIVGEQRRVDGRRRPRRRRGLTVLAEAGLLEDDLVATGERHRERRRACGLAVDPGFCGGQAAEVDGRRRARAATGAA